MMEVHYMVGLYLISFKIQDLYKDYLTFVPAERVFSPRIWANVAWLQVDLVSHRKRCTSETTDLVPRSGTKFNHESLPSKVLLLEDAQITTTSAKVNIFYMHIFMYIYIGDMFQT